MVVIGPSHFFCIIRTDNHVVLFSRLQLVKYGKSTARLNDGHFSNQKVKPSVVLIRLLAEMLL